MCLKLYVSWLHTTVSFESNKFSVVDAYYSFMINMKFHLASKHIFPTVISDIYIGGFENHALLATLLFRTN